MQIRRVVSAKAIDDHTLLVRFDNGEEKRYDVAPLFARKDFAALKDAKLFEAVKVEKGGYAVFWNADIDISEYELWRNGQTP